MTGKVRSEFARDKFGRDSAFRECTKRGQRRLNGIPPTGIGLPAIITFDDSKIVKRSPRILLAFAIMQAVRRKN